MAAPFAVRAVTFDLDGVLVDTEEINVRAAFEAFRAHGCELVPEDAREIVGRHPEDYVPVLAARFGLDDEVQATLRAEQDRTYLRLWHEKAGLKEGAREVLEILARRGFPLALATSAGRRHVDRCLRRFGLEERFAEILTKDDVAGRKPDPEIYLECARRLRLPPSRVLVVEDSIHGVEAAKRADCPCVAVATSYTPRAAREMADAVVPDLTGLLDLLPPEPAAGTD